MAIMKKLFDAAPTTQTKGLQKKTTASKPSFGGAFSGVLKKSSGTPASSRKPDMSIMPVGKKASKKPDMSIMPVSPKTKKKVGY